MLAKAETLSAHGENDIVFTLANDATTSCTLIGWPGVSLLNSGGQQVGPDAARYPSPKRLVTLAPGGRAEFHEVDPQAACADAPAAPQIRVYPPNQLASMRIAVHLFVCHPSVTAVAPYTPNGPPVIG